MQERSHLHAGKVDVYAADFTRMTEGEKSFDGVLPLMSSEYRLIKHFPCVGGTQSKENTRK